MKTHEEYLRGVVEGAVVRSFGAHPAHHNEIVQIDFDLEIRKAVIELTEGHEVQIVTDNSMYRVIAHQGARYVEKYDRKTKDRVDIRSFQGFKPRTPGCGVVFKGGYTTTPVLRWRLLKSS